VNVEGVGHIAEAARRHGAFMVHLSSDHAVAPVNMYGRTKLAAEGLVPGLVLRGKFYSKQHWLLRALREGRPVQLLTTCWFNPLTSATLVAYLDALVAGRRRGVVNVGVMDRISYHEFGLLMCEVFGLPARLIGEVTTLELPYVLPADTYLDVSGLAGLGLKSLTARQDMERLAA